MVMLVKIAFFFTAGGGDNVAIGGADSDQFWIVNAEFPETVNVISDYEVGVDVIGVAGLGVGFEAVELKQVRGSQRNNHPALVRLKVSYYRDLLGEGWMIIFL